MSEQVAQTWKEGEILDLAARVVGPRLTRREAFAMAAMQGMLAYGDESSHYTTEGLPSAAVKMADDLLALLALQPIQTTEGDGL